MANFFPKWMNWLPLKLVVCIGVVLAAIAGGAGYYFTPKYTQVGYEPLQPVPFSHALHVHQLAMDCRYCHSFVEIAAHANVPTTQVCMACHTQIQAASPHLEAVRESWKTGKPINWVRVHQVPDYTYFNHAVHVSRGVSCQNCHGAVKKMKTLFQQESQSMAWCLDCHLARKNPALPPQAPGGNLVLQLDEKTALNTPVTCGGCHR
jgi:hypothetical protein